MPHTKTLFLLADGARARLVERSRANGDFVTIEEFDGRRRLEGLRAELKASRPAMASTPHSSHADAVGEDDFTRQAKEDFVAEIADHAVEVCRKQGFMEIFVAAPPRLVGALRDRVAAHANLAGSLGRDLTKAPDATLPKWLDHVRPGA